MRRPERTLKRTPARPEPKWLVSSIAPECLVPERHNELSEAITKIFERRIQECQYVALRDTLKVDKPDAKLPEKTKPGPDSVEAISWSVFHRLYPNGPGGELWKVIRGRVKEVMERDHTIKVTVRTLARHGLKKGIA